MCIKMGDRIFNNFILSLQSSKCQSTSPLSVRKGGGYTFIMIIEPSTNMAFEADSHALQHHIVIRNLRSEVNNET